MGRIALRREGLYWNAYYAMPDTMDNAILLGSIRIALVEQNEARKRDFIRLFTSVIAETLEDLVGHKPEWNERPAAK